MSCNLNSLKRGYIREYVGDYYRDNKGEYKELDYSSCGLPCFGLCWGSVVFSFKVSYFKSLNDH